MNYGLYLSAAGTLTSLHRQDVLSGNLSNAQTPGFKPDMVISRQRLPERAESGQPIDSKRLLEALGGGIHVQPTYVVNEQGSLDPTDGPLDLAIQGDGLFVVESPGGGGDVRFTRDGRFTIDDTGHLVMSTNGLRVLDVDGRPIRIDDGGAGQLHILDDGTINRDNRTLARLQVVSSDAGRLVKSGRGLMRFESAPDELPAATGTVRQGFTELSSVDPVMTLHRLMTVSQAIQANSRLMQYQDFIMGQAVNTFGRVA